MKGKISTFARAKITDIAQTIIKAEAAHASTKYRTTAFSELKKFKNHCVEFLPRRCQLHLIMMRDSKARRFVGVSL